MWYGPPTARTATGHNIRAADRPCNGPWNTACCGAVEYGPHYGRTLTGRILRLLLRSKLKVSNLSPQKRQASEHVCLRDGKDVLPHMKGAVVWCLGEFPFVHHG